MFRLKELRLESGLKRSKVANELQINAGTLANYENGIREAPYEYLIKFADYYDVSVDYLLGNDDKGVPPRKDGDLTADEIAVLEGYRKLSRLGKERVYEYIELWSERK